MEIIPKDSVLFRAAIDALAAFLPQAQLCFKEDGLAISGMDTSHVGFVDYYLSSADCLSWSVPKPLTIGISTPILARTLAAVGAGEKVTLSMGKSQETLVVSYVNDKLAKKAVYSIHTLEIDASSLDLPELTYAATVIAKTSDIVSVAKEVAAFADAMTFTLDEEGFHLSATGDAGKVTQTLVNTEDRTMELAEDTVTATYGTKYLMSILKGGGPMSATTKLEFDPTQPLRAVFTFGNDSRFVAYLAPKIVDEN
jgi:hypothetical protein